MSPVSTSTPETAVAPPQKPSRWAVGWATLLGYVLSAALLAIVAVAADAAFGLPNAPGRGLFYRYDGWSWAAEACVGLIVTFVTAWAVSDQLRSRTGWEVPFGFAFGTLLVTGYAPALALTPLYGAAAPVSLIVATWILHRRCEPGGAEPMKMLGRVPRRYRRGAAIGLAVAGPLMFAYVLGYAATHPLENASGFEQEPYEHDPGSVHRYPLLLDNVGTATVTDLSIVRVEGTPALQLERAGKAAGEFTWNPRNGPPTAPLLRLDRVELEPGNDSPVIELELRQGRLCPEPLAALDAVWVRYSVRGMRHEQRLTLSDPPAVRCGRTADR